jgi:hypothetical protein
MSQDAAVALARAKVHGLVKNHIMEKDDDGGTPILKAASVSAELLSMIFNFFQYLC